MSMIEGVKVSDTFWQKLTVLLLGLCLGGGTWFANRAIDTLDDVAASVIRHEVEIQNMKTEINLLRGGKTELTPGDVGNPRFHFRGGMGGPKRDVPRPPHDPPTLPDQPTEPKRRDKEQKPEKAEPPDKDTTPEQLPGSGAADIQDANS